MEVTTAYDTVLDVVRAASPLGHETCEDGTEVFGRAPHIGPDAWLHILFAPLTEDQVRALEFELNAPIPKDYASWLLRANGLDLFGGTFALHGLRRDYSRVPNVHEPFHLRTANVYERPQDAEDSFFFFGSYDWDGSRLYLDRVDNRIHWCTRQSSKSLATWPDVGAMIVAESSRLTTLFDERGQKRDPSRPTTPTYQPTSDSP